MGALGATVLGALLGSHAVDTFPAESSYRNGFWVLSVVLTLGAVAARLVPQRRTTQFVPERGPVSVTSEQE